MTHSSLGVSTAGHVQRGLWGLEVQKLRAISTGESTTYEVETVPIKSVLPMINDVNEGRSTHSLGARCHAMSELRHVMVHSLLAPQDYRRIKLSPGSIMANANSAHATEYSQETLVRLLAMQLIGSGYNIGDGAFPPDLKNTPVIGAPGGFQGNTHLGKTLWQGLNTRTATIEKLTTFMQTVRGLARQYLQNHEREAGSVEMLGDSEQLAHRARLILLAAEPDSIRNQAVVVQDLLRKLNVFEKQGIRNGLTSSATSAVAQAVNDARQVLVPALTSQPARSTSHRKLSLV